MAAGYNVMTIFKASDQVSATYDRMGQAADRFRRKTSSAFRNATKEGYKFGTIVKGVLAANIIRGGIGAIGGGLQQVGNDFLEFEDTMVSAAAKFDDISFKSKNFGKELQQLTRDYRKFALGTRYSAVEVAKAGEQFAESGWLSTNTAGVIPYLIKAGEANREKDVGEFGKSVLGIFQGFGMKTGNAEKDSAGFVTLLDQITQASVDALGGITELKESMKVIAPIWGSSETSAAALAFSVMGQNAGFSGEMIGTAGKNVKQRLADPLIAETLKANGIDITDLATGKVKTVQQLLTAISSKFKELNIKPGSAQELSIGKYLFGSWGLAATKNVMANLRVYGDEIEKIEKGSKGVAGDISGIVREYSTYSKVLALAGTVTEKFFTIFERFNKKGQSGIEGLIERIQNWNPEGLISGLEKTWFWLDKLWTVADKLGPAVFYAGVFFLSFKAAMAGLMLLETVTLFMRLFTAARLAIGTMGALNLIMAANPVMLIASAIALAVVGLVWLEQKFGLFSTAWDFWAAKVKTFFGWMGKLVDWFFKATSNGIGGISEFGKALANFTGEEKEGGTGKPRNPFYGENAPPAPNAKEAAARQGQWNGVMRFENTPPGTTFTQKSSGVMPITFASLGMAQ